MQRFVRLIIVIGIGLVATTTQISYSQDMYGGQESVDIADTEVKMICGDGAAGDDFGFAVSLSGDRALIGAVGAVNGSSLGAAYVFEFDGALWSEVAKLLASDGEAGDQFGCSVSLDGDRALVGSCGDRDHGGNSGSAYVFDLGGTTWSETVKLDASDGESGDFFGISVSLRGNRAIVGAFRDNAASAPQSGSAYVFDYNGTSWEATVKLTAGDHQAGDQFGVSVSQSGDRVLIGSRGDDDNGEDSGSAYVFDFDGTSWMETAKLTATYALAGDQFGTSVSLSGDRALIGSRGDDDNGENSGSAFVLDFDGTSWVEMAQLTASDGREVPYFGGAVSLDGNRALVGTPWDDERGARSGAAYTFDFDETSWNETAKLTASDGTTGDFFGHAVSVSGDRVLVGAYGDDDYGETSGSAYVFEVDSPTVPGLEDSLDLPAEYLLHQNFPNPINSTSRISYDLSRLAEVTLTVHDVLGRQVQVLAFGTNPAGQYEVSLDATALPSGIYFYRLESENFVETKRMVVMK